jgi:hypothetical protein
MAKADHHDHGRRPVNRVAGEVGTFTVQVNGPSSMTRVAGLSEAMETAQSAGDVRLAAEAIAVGDAVTLETGDAAYILGNLIGEIRNDGQERAVGLAFLVGPAEGIAGEATPARSPTNTFMTPRPPTAWAHSGASCSTLGGTLRALARLDHVEHPRGLNVDDLGIAIATHDWGDYHEALLAVAHDATGFQPGVEAAHFRATRCVPADLRTRSTHTRRSTTQRWWCLSPRPSSHCSP